MEQAPGPRGSPQLPQPRPEGLGDDAPFADTAKTDNCGASFLLWHCGQSAFSLPYTSASKEWLHSLQTYSKIGILHSRSHLPKPIKIKLWEVRKRNRRCSRHDVACAAAIAK